MTIEEQLARDQLVGGPTADPVLRDAAVRHLDGDVEEVSFLVVRAELMGSMRALPG